jgi:heat shock protein HspQ
MTRDTRLQLHDEIVAGKYDVKDCSDQQLAGFRVDFDYDYSPSEEFFFMVSAEIRRRRAVPKMTKINRDFFKE